MAAWRARVARDDKGKLHLVNARYDTSDPSQRCGMAGLEVFNEGNTIEDIKRYAERLLHACDEPVITMAEYEREPDDDEDEDDD